MDVTGQAFEDMQEQNSRLLQQLREKDDANFKLMSERIKSNQIYKLLKEEKEELADQVLTFKTQVMYNLQTATPVVFTASRHLSIECYCCRHPPGGCPAVSRSEAGRKRGCPAEHTSCSGKRAGCAHTSTRTQQEKGEKRLAINHIIGYDLLPLIAARCSWKETFCTTACCQKSYLSSLWRVQALKLWHLRLEGSHQQINALISSIVYVLNQTSVDNSRRFCKQLSPYLWDTFIVIT